MTETTTRPVRASREPRLATPDRRRTEPAHGGFRRHDEDADT